ncbi:hypothetical protein L8106_29790 [Lyngbya sp. PCC 8106]|nr:hypothetical protein L8106_29790 [Lyngbya sp. PCC 8106]
MVFPEKSSFNQIDFLIAVAEI